MREEPVVLKGNFCFDLFNCPFALSFFVKHFLLFMPCAVISGLFYLRVILTLKKGKLTRSKSRLSKCLCVLWLSWVLLSLPLTVFEIWHQSLPQESFLHEYSSWYWTSHEIDRRFLSQSVRKHFMPGWSYN